jgi:hypothetical protein
MVGVIINATIFMRILKTQVPQCCRQPRHHITLHLGVWNDLRVVMKNKSSDGWIDREGPWHLGNIKTSHFITLKHPPHVHYLPLPPPTIARRSRTFCCYTIPTNSPTNLTPQTTLQLWIVPTSPAPSRPLRAGPSLLFTSNRAVSTHPSRPATPLRSCCMELL